MFGGVGKTGEIIHQLCHMVFHAEEVMGRESAKNLLVSHPFLVRHSPPEGRLPDFDQFWFGRELSPFWFVVPPEKLSIQFHGQDKSFKGFTGIATAKSRYMVKVERPLMGPVGSKAKPLADWFIKKFDALDTGRLSSR